MPSVIAVVDLQGKVVGEYVPRRERENEIRIYPANLAPGLYHIKDFRKFRREKKVIFFSKLWFFHNELLHNLKGLSKKTETAELKENSRRESLRNALIFSSPGVKPGQVQW
jgi:hypothetical protein